MIRRRALRTVRVVTAALLLCGDAQPLVAQVVRQPREPRGLFGSGLTSPNRQHTLDLTVSLLGGYDDNAAAGERGGESPRVQQASPLFGGSALLAYSRSSPRWTLAFNGQTSARRLTSLDLVGAEHIVSGGLSVQTGRRTTILVSQDAGFTPFYQFQLFPQVFVQEPGELPTSRLDLQVRKRDAYFVQSRGLVSHRVGRRTTLHVTARHRRFDFTDEASPDLRSSTLGGGMRHAVSRHATVKLGYNYRIGHFGDRRIGSSTEGHNVDAGVDYERPLSISRNTSVSFSTGSAIFKSADRTFLRATGTAALRHQIGRSWTAAAVYERDVGFIQGFDEPVATDGVFGVLSGLLTRRLALRAQGGFSTGHLTTSRSDYSTVYGTGTMSVALSRFSALDVTYLYYNYRFDDPLRVPLSADGRVDRHGVRTGLTILLPLVR